MYRDEEGEISPGDCILLTEVTYVVRTPFCQLNQLKLSASLVEIRESEHTVPGTCHIQEVRAGGL